MKRLVFMMVMFFVVVGFCGLQPVYAQTLIGGCTQVSWNANSETDLAGYKVYVEEEGVWKTPVDVGNVTTALCEALPIREGHNYRFQVTAYDTSGNESAPSQMVAMNWPDVTKPTMVTNVCWDVTEIVIDNTTGKIVSSTPNVICQ